MNIPVSVRRKHASVNALCEIVCGNGDYAVTFDFDEEWSEFPVKTTRFVWSQNGTPVYQDVVFQGDTVAMPPVYGCHTVAIGVYAGDIRTSTPARVPCHPCITDGTPCHQPPTEDVYNQLASLIRSSTKPANAAGSPVTHNLGGMNAFAGQREDVENG